MKNKTIRKIEYLEYSLAICLAAVEKEDGPIVIEDCANTQHREIFEYKGFQRFKNEFLPSLTIFFIFIIVFPFLIIGNLIALIGSIVDGIPFRPVPIPVPAKMVDITDYNIKLEIRPREHAPPHFHIIVDDIDYSMTILSGQYIGREITNAKYRKAIERWYKKNRNLLIKVWNEKRPSDCMVGRIK